MSDLARREPAAAYLQPTAIETWAADLTLAYEAARKLVQTSFVPAQFRNKPEEAAAAIMTGAEVGLTPLAALRAIVVIQGTPAFTAVALRGLALAHGHQVWLVEQTATRAIVRGRRAGEEQQQESIWTIDRARGLQLVGKDNWKKQPMAMLVARATSELVRLIAADVLLGVPYSAEELEDGLAEVGVDTPLQPVKPARRTAQRKALPAPAEEPPLPEDTAPDPEEPPLDDEPPMALEASEPATPAYDQAVADEWAAQIAATEDLGTPRDDRDADTLFGLRARAIAAGVYEAWADDPDIVEQPKTIEQLVADRRAQLQKRARS